jgi:hypothetical protein
MENHDDYISPTTAQIIDDYISDVELRWMDLDQYQKESPTFSYTEVSLQEQNYIRHELVETDLKAAQHDIAIRQQELNESDEWAACQLDKQSRQIYTKLDRQCRLSVVSSYILDRITPEERKNWRHLRENLQSETDKYKKAGTRQKYNNLCRKLFSTLPNGCRQFLEVNEDINRTTNEKIKEELRTQWDKLQQEIFQQIPEEEKCQRLNSFYNGALINVRTTRKAQEEIGAPQIGYCLKAITESLHKITQKYGLDLGLPKNTTENGIPQTFLEEMKKSAGKYVYQTQSNLTFEEIVKQNKIHHGAIVILDNKAGIPTHAMFWNGARDMERKPILMGFNTMDLKKNMSFSANGCVRTGTIIDIGRMIDDCNPQRIRQACRDIYREGVSGLMAEKAEKDLENLFMETTGKYKMQASQSLTNENIGRSVH